MKYDLVFEGGGAKGMIFAGALEEFEKAGHTHHRLLGSSAGAITATLLAAGYDSAQLLAATNERTADDESVFTQFMGQPGPFDDSMVANSALLDFFRSIDIPLIPNFIEERIDNRIISALLKKDRFQNLFSFVEEGGWFSASQFVTWMTEKLNEGTYTAPDGTERPRNFGSMTLNEFFEATGKHLVVTASDTTGGQILILNHQTAPRLPGRLGHSDVDEHAPCMARSRMERRMGPLSRSVDHGSRHCRRRHVIQLPYRTPGIQATRPFLNLWVSMKQKM